MSSSAGGAAHRLTHCQGLRSAAQPLPRRARGRGSQLHPAHEHPVSPVLARVDPHQHVRPARAPAHRPQRVRAKHRSVSHPRSSCALTAGEDRQIMVAGAKFVRKISEQLPLRRIIVRDSQPLNSTSTDAEWLAHVEQTAAIPFHPCYALLQASPGRWSDRTPHRHCRNAAEGPRRRGRLQTDRVRHGKSEGGRHLDSALRT